MKLLAKFLHPINESTGTQSAAGIVEEMGEFVMDLIQTLPGSLRADVFLDLAGNSDSLSLSEYVVLRAVKEHGKWTQQEPGSGLAEDKRLLRDWQTVSDGRDLWLEQVRARARDSSLLLDEPNALGVFFRWGQLAEDSFREVSAYIAELIGCPDGLKALLSLFRPNHRLQGIEKLVGDWSRFKDLCLSHPERESFRSDLWIYFDHLQAGEAVSKTEEIE